ncbi:MAG TPA: NAD(+) diphosphatase [Treponema sp.]|nr:NAD(+) diphosphatase [Treponema sp.]
MPPSIYIFCPDEILLLETNDVPSWSTKIEALPSIDRMKIVFEGNPVYILLIDEPQREAFVTVCAAESGKKAQWVPIRSLLGADCLYSASLAALAGKAFGLIQWHSVTKHCVRCGAPLFDHATENALQCRACTVDYYPRLSPAIIVLVHKDDKILLVRHANRIQHLFSCVAGYVEHGETLESCVKREVLEETGISVQNVRYAGSQSWPFPDQYMIAFYADWESGDLQPDGDEVIEASWFSRDALPSIPSPASVAWKLIMDCF